MVGVKRMKLSKVLVTGGAGFIGSHLVDRLLSEGFEVWVLDDFSSGRMENVAHHKDEALFHLVKGDIKDSAVVNKVVKDVDAVFHEAALVDVALSVKDPLLFDDVNVDGTLNLLKASLDSNVKRFIFASSAAVLAI
jgi:nucleoside-diphosphate-sugar epimerase